MENFLTSLQDKRIVIIALFGLALILAGIFFYKSGLNFGGTKVEVLSSSTQNDNPKSITVEIAGEVENPGVYKLTEGSRIDDLLSASGGLSAKADRSWTDKYLNRASVLTDGQKVYIPSVDQQTTIPSANERGWDQTTSSAFSSDSNALININSASLQTLDTLPGIGQVYGQSIIEHRPYSTVEELVSKGALKSSVYQKIKDRVAVY